MSEISTSSNTLFETNELLLDTDLELIQLHEAFSKNVTCTNHFEMQHEFAYFARLLFLPIF